MNGETAAETATNISVVVPTYNRLPRLKHVIRALERQTVPFERFEVIVVSDGGTDGTNDYLRNLATPLNLIPLILENGGPARARNRGVERAGSPLILFLDDDVVPAPELIAVHLRQHQRHGANLVVLGPMLTPDDHPLSPWIRWEQAQLYKQYDAMVRGEFTPTARQFYTGNSSVPRDALLAAGGFDETLRRAEDIELGFRLAEFNMRFIFCMEARGYHYAERTFQSWINIAYAYGRNAVIFSGQDESSWHLKVTLREFYQRKPILQRLTLLCLDRPQLTSVLFGALRLTAHGGKITGLDPLLFSAGSAMYNIRYYQGVADQLGGGKELVDRLSAGRQKERFPAAPEREV